MKHKLKKWHIALMSVLALFIAVFASLFSLQADTVDDETGEVLTDNWEISTVLYDSTVNSGETPLTEINWDASDGSYKDGTPRVITVQINYKNTSAITTYQPNELKITIPNLIFSDNYEMNNKIDYDELWKVEIIASGNDTTHSNYDWTFVPQVVGSYSFSSPHINMKYLYFTNANTIEAGSNFEGSIQIKYTITPKAEIYGGGGSYSHIIEKYIDECIHNYSKTLQASLGNTSSNVIYEIVDNTVETTITSPNWPEKYPSGMTVKDNYWEYTSSTFNNLAITFENFALGTWDYVYIYDQKGDLCYSLDRYSGAANKTYYIEGNHVKIAMKSSSEGTGFVANISGATKIIPKDMIFSNEIQFNYTRRYVHPWLELDHTIDKTASELTSLDGIQANANDYYFVKYTYTIKDGIYTQWDQNRYYPYIMPSILYIQEEFNENCLVYDGDTMALISPQNGIYNITKEGDAHKYGGYDRYIKNIIVCYPKSIYNEENNNLLINSTAELFIDFVNKHNNVYQDDAELAINLADFEFEYPSGLYSITKSAQTYGNLYSKYLLEQDFFHTCNTYTSHINSGTRWYIPITAMYTGSPMTVRFGDDLLYITANDGTYRKLLDNEYFLDFIYLPTIKNMNGTAIAYDKYITNLYVRYADETSYVLYKNLSDQKAGNLVDFTKEEKIVAFYIEIEDAQESIVTSFSLCTVAIQIKPINDIALAGKIYNFGFLQVFFKDDSGNLILQNEPTLDSYATLETQDNIATYDLETYKTYIQRAVAERNYSEFKDYSTQIRMGAYKKFDPVIQNVGDECFEIICRIGNISQHGIEIINSDKNYMQKVYLDNISMLDLISSIEIYDLLPEGMELISTEEELINSIYASCSSAASSVSNPNTSMKYIHFYNSQGEPAFSSNKEHLDFIKEHSTVTVTENWKGTGRTHIAWIIDISENPIIDLYEHLWGYFMELNCRVTYDSYLEFGEVYINRAYLNGLNTRGYQYAANGSADSGISDQDETDINNNGSITDKFNISTASVTINSIISTHQDLTTYVKTDQSTYSTEIVDASNNSEYEYKLRARTGVANITNLIIYTNLEEAQPSRTRWKGEFLGIDTSYAENKGYTVKPYYSENPQAGNLYNEDGSLNSEWKLYSSETLPELYQTGLEIKFNSQCKTESVNYDWVEIYYVLDGTTYKLGRWGGSDLAGKTIQVPTKDFYLYWHTDGSSCSYYGFSIDYIKPTHVEEPPATTGSIPSYTIEEIQDNVYPDSAFGSYTHGNYGNSVNKLWHYTYTKEFVKIQDAVTATDKTKVKSLAFEYLKDDRTPAVLPANSLTYVTIQMKSPADENIKTLARMDCWSQWNALDEFDQPVDFITGINSNVVKVALPNSVKTDDVPSISLRFTKKITGSEEAFKNMNINIANNQIFKIRLTSLIANDDGSYNQITALLNSNQELVITQIPVGTYLLEELNDNYFDFVDFTDNNDSEVVINGVIFEQTDQGYVITVSEDLSETIEFNIKVTNEIEDERFYEDKSSQENLFLKNKIEDNGMIGDEPEGQ